MTHEIATRRSLIALAIFALCPAAIAVRAQSELRFAIRSDPRSFHPMRAADPASETVRYLTSGVLLRLNRTTHALEPELALNWKIDQDGKRITFRLREGVFFSDGSPFTSEDVVYTMSALMDPGAISSVVDNFRQAPGTVRTESLGKYQVRITFPDRMAALDRLFDQLSILSKKGGDPALAVLGPYRVAEHSAGVHVLLRRNPRYWKKDSQGRRLPYIDVIRLVVQSNRDTELLRFRRGELDLIESLDTNSYDRLAQDMPQAAVDAGVSLETEQMWFNQSSAARVPPYKLAWFRSTPFRRAVSEAIRREDLCRVVYHGRAEPAAGMTSPANHFWVNRALKPPADPGAALARLRAAGFRLDGGVLRDSGHHPIEFSLITNAGNKERERMAAMIQQDLKQIGIKVNIVTLDLPSLLERITRTLDYESCLLGAINVDLDPQGQMNLWLSSGTAHQWNPGQKTPATAWEAEIDRLMRAQASSLSPKQRKASFDKVQEIVAEQVPFIYLVYKHSLSAVSPRVRGAAPNGLRPRVFWNVEFLSLKGADASGGAR